MRRKEKHEFSVYRDVVRTPCDGCSRPDCDEIIRTIVGPEHVSYEIAGVRWTGDVIPGTGRWEEIKP